MSELSQTLAQVFPYEFWEVFENTFLDRTSLMAASVFIYFKIAWYFPDKYMTKYIQLWN